MTVPEVILWSLLVTRPAGLKFRRQHPFGPYVLDFYCASARLCIEVDGAWHLMGSRPTSDQRRDAWLLHQHIRTLRIPAAYILDDLNAVAAKILSFAAPRP